MSQRKGVVIINNFGTVVRTWGRWIEDEPTAPQENIIVIFPGNPGVSEFYWEFAELLHKKLGHVVWVVGYAGHELLPGLEGNEDLYNLKGQIAHKEKFIETYVPEDAHLQIIAHSIGSYLTLQLLENKEINKRIEHVYLLFPTIEYMAETRNGKVLTGFVKPILWLVLFLSAIFTFLPSFIQYLFIKIYLLVRKIPQNEHTLNAIVSLIHPKVLKNVFGLAYDEMERVRARNDEIIKKNISKLKLIYGATDGWAPARYFNNITRDIPQLDALLTNYDHAFVLTHWENVGNLVTELMQKK